MPSPPRQHRGSPPRREALHERSESHTNEKHPPSLRIVGSPEASIYHSNPYPTKPSQILRPGRSQRGQGSAFEGVSQGTSQSADHALPPSSPTHVSTRRTPNRSYDDTRRNTQRSSADASVYSVSTDRSLSESPRDLETNTSFLTEGEGEERGGEIANTEGDRGRTSGDSVVQLPSVPPRAKDHSASPSSWKGGKVVDRQPANKESDSSLNSTNSTGTVIVKKTRDGKKRASYTAFPFSRPSSSKSNLTISTPPRPARIPSDETSAPRSPVSPSTPMSSTFAPSTERRISSLPADSSPPDGGRRSVEFQFPVVKPQLVSASWAESSSTPHRGPRVAERGLDRWNPHLSTVHSEANSSLSGGRSSQGTVPLDSSRASKSSLNIMSNPRLSSEGPPPMPARSPNRPSFSQRYSSSINSDTPNLPSPPPIRQREREFSGSTIRMVGDQTNPAGPRPGRSRDISGATIRLVQDYKSSASSAESSKPTPSTSSAPSARHFPQPIRMVPQENVRNPMPRPRPTSRASIFRDNIPAWAK